MCKKCGKKKQKHRKIEKWTIIDCAGKEYEINPDEENVDDLGIHWSFY